MSELTITPGRFVWHELITQDVDKSTAFYQELFGWRCDASDPSYVHLFAGDVPVGGMLPARTPEMTTQWWPYASVADVDAATARAAAVGCKVLMGPMTIEPGRLTALADPQGAHFYVWRLNGSDPPEVERPMLGSFCWDQLNTPDVEASYAVYSQVFGWTRTAFPGVPNLFTLMRAERQAASLMQGPPGMPAHWLTYVAVDKLDTARDRAKRLGGKVLVERIELGGVGAFSVLQDSLGAMIAAFEPGR
jgi:predicted enzyme related to lactoylglutathione lyase